MFMVQVYYIPWIKVMNPRISFLSRQETAFFLMRDPDGYVRGMSSSDLCARGGHARGHAEYIRQISNAADDFTILEKQRLSEAVRFVDGFYEPQESYGIDSRKFRSLPWIFAKTRGKTYDNGFPHTRQKIVFLTDASLGRADLEDLLFHERMHIYQRTYPGDIQRALGRMGIVRKCPSTAANYRRNPDEDGYVYLNTRTKKVMGTFYASQNPRDLVDVLGTAPHPYELMAEGKL
jgi:hypothetical protein